MGRASRRKLQNRLTEVSARLAAAERRANPWWESNLLWGGVIGFALLSVTTLQRWPLFLAWGFSWPIARSAAKKLIFPDAVQTACLSS
jgi:hypothetical protein